MFSRLLFVSLLVGLTACASDRGPQAKDRYAMIYTGDSRKAEGIFPVSIYQIDGREVASASSTIAGRDLGRDSFRDRQSHRIRPGRHTIKARGIVDRAWVPGVSRDLSRESNEPLEYLFQSGMRYYIGIKADSPRRAEWELVVWKAEPMKEGSHTFDD